MAAFEYAESRVPVRKDLGVAHRQIWKRLAAPGCWWTGAERVAIAAEVRNAPRCPLCRERKQALSPYAIEGEHDHLGALPAAAVDVIHRVMTDPSRLSKAWAEKTLAGGISDGHFVELLGVVVAVVSIDSLHRGLGVPPEALPEPLPGEPTHYRPAQAVAGTGFVPMLPVDGATGPEADLWDPGHTANVIRAMSLVPDAVRDLLLLSRAHYLPVAKVGTFGANGGRALDRMQIELIAGRVSALNECFY